MQLYGKVLPIYAHYKFVDRISHPTPSEERTAAFASRQQMITIFGRTSRRAVFSGCRLVVADVLPASCVLVLESRGSGCVRVGWDLSVEVCVGA